MSIGGVMGKNLVVDLGKGSLNTEQLADQVYLDYLGGYGIGSYLIYQRSTLTLFRFNQKYPFFFDFLLPHANLLCSSQIFIY